MKSGAGTPIVVSSREPPKHVCSKQISTNNLRGRDPAGVFRCFAGGELAGDAEQRTGWEFSGASPAESVVSFRVVWIDRSHR